ncbi:MAG: ComF family protein [Myxococcales bacterium]|nr:ComF family protein [Myxococcales bacterium]
MTMKSLGKALWNALWQLLAPPVCAACDEPLHQPNVLLCADCAALCEPCPAQTMPLVPGAPHCLSRFAYGGPVQTALLRLKWQGRDDLARPLGLLLRPILLEMLQTFEADWLVPIPLHPQRLRERGYNQAMLLARAAMPTQPSSLTLHAGLLSATRPTAAAHRQRRIERIQRVESRFVVPRRAQAHITQRKIILIDDVITTGATVTACAEALRQAGARDVQALSLLRVV